MFLISLNIVGKTIMAGMASLASSMIDAAFFTYESTIAASSDPLEYNYDLEKPVWVLGQHFKPDDEMEKLNELILSKLWFTYRRNFTPIGETGPMSDTGWGCTLRCGQMMLAQALICRHLGREWTWKKGGEGNEKYMMILKYFLDTKDSVYSIHHIAQTGLGEGKSIGQWFGPNTISQVIRKLVMFDEMSDIAVHVAMDNTVVVEDIKTLCMSERSSWGCNIPPVSEKSLNTSTTETPIASNYSCAENSSSSLSKGPNEIIEHKDVIERQDVIERECDQDPIEHEDVIEHKSDKDTVECDPKWSPLLLFIPLRLGLIEINSDYYSSLKAMFTLKQCLGVIGGKPNHAHYFIGFNGDRLLYLDPHTTHDSVEDTGSGIPDETYHCATPCFMNFSSLDPSLALGFYCDTEEIFDDWVRAVRELVIDREKRPMFEICEERPSHWPPFQFPKRSCYDSGSTISEFDEQTYDYGVEAQVFDSSGEYEII